MEFDIVVKGIRYDLHAYKELRDEWDLVVNGKLIGSLEDLKTYLK